MLAVQQQPHRMGSTQPESDPFLPFGYAVDPDQEPLFDAPEPPPGAPLLSENDNKFLTSFFEDMTANQYNMPSFGEGLNFSDAWLDLPPQFMGTATSLGQQDNTPLASPMPQGTSQDLASGDSSAAAMSQMMPPPTPSSSSHRRHPSDDVLNAAATLLQNGASSRRGSSSADLAPSRRPPPVGHLRHQALEEFKEEGRRGMPEDGNDHIFAEWIYGPQVRHPPRNAPPPDMQWGSDSNFSSVQAYLPMSKETSESMSQAQMKCLECLEVNKSANTTRPSSPTNGGAVTSSDHRHVSSDLPKRSEDVDAPPRKRRKSKNIKDIANEDIFEESTPQKSSKQQRKKSERSNDVPSSPAEDVTMAGKRRKPAVNLPKQSRENLSEEQKRENHIKSEQRRRTLIKEGFEDLCELVPGLRGGGFSKSTMLTMAAEWLEDMLEGNEALAAQLSSVERR